MSVSQNLKEGITLKPQVQVVMSYKTWVLETDFGVRQEQPSFLTVESSLQVLLAWFFN